MTPARATGLIVLSVVTIVSFAPILALIASGLTATALGCTLDEGSIHPCGLGGFDLGDALYTGFVLGWLALLTWPGMLLTTIAWLVILIRVVRWRHTLLP